MKKHFILLATIVSSIAFAQTKLFTPETKAMYKKLHSENVTSGLSKEEATANVLENADFTKLYYNDLKNSNKELSKNGIILAKDFIRITNHKKVAILPFSTKIESGKKKQSKKENIKKEENAMDMIQDKMYKHFSMNQFDYSVEFQDIDRTNQILRSSGLWNNLSRTPTEEIAKALGVDAVIRGDYGQGNQKLNDVQKTAQFIGQVTSLGLFSHKNTEGVLTLSIADAKTGDVLWRKESTDTSMSSKPEKILKYIMKSVEKDFPYQTNFFE